MIIVKQEIAGSGLSLITPKVFKDDRGYFFETFLSKDWDIDFVQDNESCSSKNVMRGLHYQLGDSVQAKLVRVVKGAVIDFVIDIRRSSKTFKNLYFFHLSEENKMQLFVPRGFAHGFISLKDDTIFSYKCDNFYDKSAERGINMFDESIDLINRMKNDAVCREALGNDYDFSQLIISEKDKIHPNLNEAELFD